MNNSSKALISKVKSTFKSKSYNEIKTGIMAGLDDYQFIANLRFTNKFTIWIDIIDALAHFWGHIDYFSENKGAFSDNIKELIDNSKNKNDILKELVKAIENREIQNEFMKSNTRVYIVRNGEARLININDGTDMAFSESTMAEIYPDGCFKNYKFYRQAEQETIETFTVISSIIGKNWAFVLPIKSAASEIFGRNLGLIPTVHITTARMDGDDMCDEEDSFAYLGMPVNLERLYAVIDDLADQPDEVYHGPQLQHIKQMLDSHFLNEELSKALSIKEAANSPHNMGKAKI